MGYIVLHNLNVIARSEVTKQSWKSEIAAPFGLAMTCSDIYAKLYSWSGKFVFLAKTSIIDK